MSICSPIFTQRLCTKSFAEYFQKLLVHILILHWTHEETKAQPSRMACSRQHKLQLIVSAKSCPTLCDPMDCSPPGSSVHGILQARILEWVAMPSCRGSSQPRDRTHILCLLPGQVGSLPLVPSGKSDLVPKPRASGVGKRVSPLLFP